MMKEIKYSKTLPKYLRDLDDELKRKHLEIEDEFRNEHFAGFNDITYFKRLLERLSILNNKEIEVDGDIVRVTKTGVDNCKRYDLTFREEF
jgi:hypothetical protein